MNKRLIAETFGKAATTYDEEAPVQKWTANVVAQHLRKGTDPMAGQGLEIGCGTGFLTKHLLADYPDLNWLITDLSDEMVLYCQNRFGEVAEFSQMDGENPNHSGPYDLIASSLAVQWFQNLESGLDRLASLLKPGGKMVVSTLAKETFIEWRNHLNDLGIQTGLHEYQSVAVLEGFQLSNCALSVSRYVRKQDYENGLAFFKSLKAIGAQKPNSAHKPLGTSAMRKALRSFQDGGACQLTYDVAVIEITKEEG